MPDLCMEYFGFMGKSGRKGTYTVERNLLKMSIGRNRMVFILFFYVYNKLWVFYGT